MHIWTECLIESATLIDHKNPSSILKIVLQRSETSLCGEMYWPLKKIRRSKQRVLNDHRECDKHRSFSYFLL